MKKVNPHFIRICRILLPIIGAILLFVGMVWLSGWSDEWVLRGSGYQKGNETVETGFFYDNQKNVKYEVSFEFASVTGDVRIQIYNTNLEAEERKGLLEDLKKNFTLVDEIEVNESGVIEFSMEEYPKDCHYFVTVSGKAGSQFEFTQSFDEWSTRGHKLKEKIKGWFSNEKDE